MIKYLLLVILFSTPALAETVKLVRVVDGDTLIVSTQENLAQSVRLMGYDAAEMKARCPEERILAVKATNALAVIVNNAKTLELTFQKPDKYPPRIDGIIEADGKDISQSMLETGLVRPYTGGKRMSWC